MEALEDAQSNSRLLLLLKTSDPRLELPLPPDLLAELHNGARVHIALAWLTPEHAFLALQARGEMWKACSNEYCEAIKNLQSQNCERDELAAENDRLRSAASAWQATAALERTRASQRNEQLSAAREVARIRDLTPAQSLSSWRLRVLYLSDSLDAPYRYRCENAVFQLRAAGVIADLATTTHGEVPNLLADYSVVVLFRVAWTPVVDKLIQRVRSNGSTLVFDVDDLVFLHPRDAGLSFLSTADSLQQLRYQGFAARIRRVVDQSDYVLTSTPALASEAIEIGKPAFCHPNLLHPAMLRTSKTVSALSPLLRHRRIISYFSGSNTHDADLRSIAPALLAVLENDPRSLLLLGGFVGVPDVFKKRAGQIVRAPYVDWRVLPWLQGMSSCNLAPLAEVNRFTQCKSALKVIEAGAVGVPTVATPTEPIRAAVRHGETGFLAATEEAWVNGISSCLSQPARKRMGQSASRLVTSVFGIDAHRGQLAKLLLSMVPGNWRCPPKPHVARPLHDLVSDVPFKTLSEFHGDRLQRASTVLKLIRSANKPQNIDCGRDWVNEYETFVAFRQRSPKEPLPPGIRFQWGYTHQLRRGSDDDSDVWIATGVDPYMVSERCDVKCGQYLTLLVSMAVTSRDSAGVAQMYWSGTRSDTFSEEFSIRFPVVADGDVHMYTIWLDRMEDGTPTKWGRSDAAGRVRFDPFDEPATIRILDLALIETAHPD